MRPNRVRLGPLIFCYLRRLEKRNKTQENQRELLQGGHLASAGALLSEYY